MLIRSWPRPRWWRQHISSQLLWQYHLNVTWNEHVVRFIGMPHVISHSHHTTHLNRLSAKHAQLWRNKLNFPECCRPTTTYKFCLRLCPRHLKSDQTSWTRGDQKRHFIKWRPDFKRWVQLGACFRVCCYILYFKSLFISNTWKVTWRLAALRWRFIY